MCIIQVKGSTRVQPKHIAQAYTEPDELNFVLYYLVNLYLIVSLFPKTTKF